MEKKPSTSLVNQWKMGLTELTKDLPVREFKPLAGYVLPRAEEREAFRAIPSWTPK